MDKVAQEFVGRVDVIAVGGWSTYEATARGAARLLPSGAVRWGFDEGLVSSAYDVTGVPTVVAVVDGMLMYFPRGTESVLRRQFEELALLGETSRTRSDRFVEGLIGKMNPAVWWNSTSCHEGFATSR